MSEDDKEAQRRAYNAAYHAANREKILARKRKQYHDNIEAKRRAAADRMAKARAKDPDKYREISRLASKARKAAKAIAEGRIPGRVGNPKRLTKEERQAYLEKWREENADKIREQDNTLKKTKRAKRAIAEGREPGRIGRVAYLTDEQRRANLLENKRNMMSRRRARQKGNGGRHSTSDIAVLFALQRGCCVICLLPFEGRKFEIDHFVPISKGGTDDRRNLRLLHRKCNRDKGSDDPYEYALKIGLLCW